MPDLSQLSDEQLEVYRDLLAKKQGSAPSPPPSAFHGNTMPDLSQLSDEQLEVYRDLLAKKQGSAPSPPPSAFHGNTMRAKRQEINRKAGVAVTPKEVEDFRNSQTGNEATGTPLDLIVNGITQAGAGMQQVGRGEYAKGAHNVLSGTGKYIAPFAAPVAVIEAPVATAIGAAGGMLGSEGAGWAARGMGAPDNYVELAKDAGGIVGGALGGAGGSILEQKLRQSLSRLGVKASKWLMQSALKPGVADAPTMEDVRAVVNTALTKNIPANEAGLTRTTGLISDIQGEIQDLVDDAAQRGTRVDPRAVVTRLDQLRSRMDLQSTPKRDLEILDGLRDEFLKTYQTRPASPPIPAQPTGLVTASGTSVMTKPQPSRPAQYRTVPADEAQARKVGTYGKAYDRDTSATYIEGQKQLGRGWKEELEAIQPRLKELNASEGELLELQNVLGRTVRREGNRDIVTGSDILAGGGGMVAAGPAGGLATAGLRRTIDSPEFKSQLALSLNRMASKSGKRVPFKDSVARAVVMIEALRGEDKADEK